MLSVRKKVDGEKGLQEQARVHGCNCAAVMLLLYVLFEKFLTCLDGLWISRWWCAAAAPDRCQGAEALPWRGLHREHQVH